jgi:cardiolipin synthase
MNKQINIPNTLSFIRILTIPAIFLLILHSTRKNYPILITIFVVSIWLDFFDGYLARKFKQETELGKILDPVADKLMVICIILALILKSDFPIWLAIVIFARDIIILAASLLLMKSMKDKKVTPSVLIGKVTFGVLGTLILVYILDLHPAVDLPLVKQFFIVLSVGFLAWSWVEYYTVYKKEKNGK